MEVERDLLLLFLPFLDLDLERLLDEEEELLLCFLDLFRDERDLDLSLLDDSLDLDFLLRPLLRLLLLDVPELEDELVDRDLLDFFLLSLDLFLE